MEEVNHKYPKTTIPNTMIAVVMIPATFFFLTNAIAVMIISSTYTIANQAVNPICNISSNWNLPKQHLHYDFVTICFACMMKSKLFIEILCCIIAVDIAKNDFVVFSISFQFFQNQLRSL